MQTDQQRHAEGISWFAETDRVPLRPRQRRNPWGVGDVPSLRFVIAFALFLVLLAASFLVDGRVVIETVQSAVATQPDEHVGEVFYALPDKAYCRHLSFDNATGDLISGNVAPCPREVARRTQTDFAWGARH
jgi:hypothetical protein